MIRWVVGPIVGALVLAPVGFGGINSDLVASAARMLSTMLLLTSAAFGILRLVWERRWDVRRG